MIDKPLKRLAHFQEKYPVLVILLVLTISAFFFYYALRIEKDSNFNVMFNDNSETIRLEKLIDTEFGGTDSLFVLVKVDSDVNDKERIQDIRHPDVIKAMDDLSRSLETETFVASTISLADLFEYAYGRLPETLEESKIMIDNFPEIIKEEYLGSFLSSDFRYQNMMVSVSVLNKPGYLEKIEDNVKEKIEQTPFPIGVSAELTGVPILINRIMEYLITDNIKTIFLAILGVFLVLWLYFRSWKIAAFSIIPVVLTLTWLAGTMHLLDIRITVMTASIGAMIVGMSVDYAIHMTHRFHERVKEGKDEALGDTVVGVGAALFASVATTVAGFLAMQFGTSPNSITQGKVLAFGVAYAFVITMLILPPLMKLQRKFIYSRLDETLFKIKDAEGEVKRNLIDKFLANLAKLQVRRPWFVLGIATLVTLLIIPGFGLVYMDTEDENWMPEDDDVIEGLNIVGYNFGGIESMNLLFVLDKTEGGDYDPDSVKDLRDPRVILPMASLDKLVQDLDWVDKVESPSTLLRRYNDGRIPKDFEEIKKVLEENPEAKAKFNDDYSIALFTPWADDIGYPQYEDLLGELDGVKFPPEVKIIPQGSVPRDIELMESLGGDVGKTTLIGFAFVIIVAALFYLSLASGLLAFFPIIIAIIWTIGMMGYINLPFTVLTTGMLSILMGMGIDFAIHLIDSVKRNMAKHGKIEEAIPDAMMSTGQAISITTITTVLGFMALSFATLVNTMRLGWTLGLGIFATFFSCMLIVPSVLTIKYKRQLKKQAVEESK